MDIDVSAGGITAPKGFRAAGAHVGLKKTKKDLALLVSEQPAAVAGCFTRNLMRAAPVEWDEGVVKSGRPVRGLVVNSGNANACTGPQGLADARAMAEALARGVGGQPEEVLVCSTGVIGVPLPMGLLTPGIELAAQQLAAGLKAGQAAAEAIMTTDTFPKTGAISLPLGAGTVTLGGMAKGSGMIHPNMATLLAFFTTDARLGREALQRALTLAVADSFNMISVDGDTSTNDTALLLANGLAGPEIPEISEGTEAFQRFCAALAALAQKLAKDVARDGEGATKLLEVRVTNARSQEDARKIARSVAASNLLKAALFGADANFGRALCAMGYSGGLFRPERVTIAFQSGQGEVVPLRQGVPCPFPEDQAKAVLSAQEIFIKADLDDGPASATAWGCDLTYDYVKINGDYRS